MVRALTTKQFIAKAVEIHGVRFDYNKVYYENHRTEVAIICKVHGEFWQRPMVHLKGHGCPMCSSKLKSNNHFIQDAFQIHGDSYDYSKVDYINAHTKVTIICFKHGEFWQKT